MVFSSNERSSVILCQYICNSFGLLGSILVMILYLGYPKIRIFAFKLIFCLSISTAGYSIGVLIGPSDSLSCPIQATIISYFSISSILWLLTIVHSLKFTILSKSSPENYFKRYLLTCSIFPLFTSIIPALTNSYSRSDLGMCWIPTNSPSSIALILFQIWFLLLAGFIYTSFYLYQLYKAAQKLRSERDEPSELLKYFNRLRGFCYIIHVAWFLPFVNMIALMAGSVSLAMVLLHCITAGLQGVFVLAAFVKDHVVYECLVDTFSGCLPCLIKKKKKNNVKKFEFSARA